MGDGLSLQLRDIHLPDPISWWPPAPGWWASLVLLTVLTSAVYCFLWNKRRWRVRIAAIAELKTISKRFHEAPDTGRLVKDLSVLLRRICMTYVPRSDVAGLTGDPWLRFLDGHVGGRNRSLLFSGDVGRALLTAPYQSSATVDGKRLLTLCDQWIRALPPLRRHR
ncbi:MAG: DUF4381 domain-containing protein [Nitrospiria bacterium]